MAFPPASYSTGQLVTAANLNANLRDNLIALNGGGLVPTGLIGLYVGGTTTIPTNWGLCDGGSGRQDLRDRVPVAAGGTYAVGATGGATSVVPADHSAHTVTQPAHGTHVVSPPDHATASSNSPHSGSGAFITSGVHTGAALSGAHTHSGATLDTVPHTHGAGISLLPPYRAHAYMQKAASGLSFTTPRTWTTGDVPTAAQMNADLRDNMNYLAALVMPLGSILIWGFYAGTIPAGWQLCDGTHGTPDLRNKFVIGAGSTYAVGTTGGNLTQRLPAHTPTHVATQPGVHGTHTPTTAAAHATVAIQNGATSFHGVDGNNGDVIDHAGFDTTAHDAHVNFGVNNHTAHDDLSMLPPFYALVYMQLISTPVFTTPRTWTTSETVEASELNTYLRDNENFINAALAPIGACAWWSGSIGSIPANWTVQPALNDYFVPGAGDGTGGFYVPAQTGGQVSVTPADHPTHTVTQPTTHAAHVVIEPPPHVSNSTWGGGGGPTSLLSPITGPTSFIHVWPIDSGLGSSNHAHAFSTDAGAAHSSHAAITTLPPYLALPFMERTS
jgi:hypothetical protein